MAIQVIACFLVIVLENLVSIESGYIVLLGIVALLLLTVFSLKTQIEVQEKSITTSKSYLGYGLV
jgi:hypothetical protein